jgi:c-di-GMP-binding flagellar brake protein YcgR
MSMDYLVDKRKYQRCSNLICKVLVSYDERNWQTVELRDISAGGMRIFAPGTLRADTKLYFQLYVYNMLSEFNLRLEGQVIRYERHNGSSIYAIRFVNIGKYQQIQLDELVKSKISVVDNHKIVHEVDDKPKFIKQARRSTRKINMYF